MADSRPVFVTLAVASKWPPRVREDVREVLERGFTLTTSPALLAAVKEMTDVIDKAEVVTS